MTRIPLFLLTATLILAAFAWAGDGCENPRTAYDATYCVAKLFVQSDNDLNEVYKELRTELSKSDQAKLKSVQLAWIKYRDAHCSATDSGGNSINVDCNYKVNRERIAELQDRLRECKTGHCRSDLVAEKSWEK